MNMMSATNNTKDSENVGKKKKGLRQNPRKKRYSKYQLPTPRALYCVCMQPYNASRYMLKCDNCDVWYHPNCIDLHDLQLEGIAGRNITFVCGLGQCQGTSSLHILKRDRTQHIENYKIKLAAIPQEEPDLSESVYCDPTEDAAEQSDASSTTCSVVELDVPDLSESVYCDPTEDAAEQSDASSTTCSVVELDVPDTFVLQISPAEWDSIKPIKPMDDLVNDWTKVLRNAFHKTNSSCEIVFKQNHIKHGGRKKASPYFRGVAVCKNSLCCTYVFSMTNEPIESVGPILIDVCRTGDAKHSKLEKIKFPVRGKERQKMASEVKEEGISNFYFKRIGQMPTNVFKAGNRTECQTPDVLSKISSDARKAEELHREVLIDIQITQSLLASEDEESSKIKGYIQGISILPFFVHLHQENQLRLFRKCRGQKQQRLTLYVDATGSTCSKIKNIPDEDKRILYYAAIIAGRQGLPPLPITEMISNSHDIPTIANWLSRLNHSVTKLYQQKLTNGLTIVVDMSWAQIQAVLLAFNSTTIGQYLNTCLAIIKKEHGMAYLSCFSVVYLCASHFIKTVHDRITKKVADKKLVKFFMFSFARLQNTTCLGAARRLYATMCHVFISKTKDGNFKQHLTNLETAVHNKDGHDIGNECADSDPEVLEVPPEGTLRNMSPFTPIFDEIVQVSQEEQEESSDINEYCMADAFQDFHQAYMHLFPLWSGILLLPEKYAKTETPSESKADDSLTRRTNVFVENWFKIVKHETLQGKKKLPVGVFIRKLHLVLKGRIRNHLDHVPKTTKSLKRLRKPIQLEEENWSPRKQGRKKKAGYYDNPNTIPVPKRKKCKDGTTVKEVDANTFSHAGLYNRENNCWLNASLQLLYSCTDPEKGIVQFYLKLFHCTLFGISGTY